MQTPHPIKFLSLSHARSVRDRLAAQALEDAEAFMHKDNAKELIEDICCAKPGWDRKLQTLREQISQNWMGNGLPHWFYLTPLADSIQYIAEKEKLSVRKS